MQELLLALITNLSGSMALVLVAIFGCVGVAVIVAGFRRANQQSHVESMAKIRANHEEAMMKIERENPQMVGGVGKDKAIEHRSNG